MHIIFLLIGLSLAMGVSSLIAFSWAIKSNQFNNLDHDMTQSLELKKDLKNAE